MLPLYIFIVFALTALFFFLKQWIYFGIDVALKRTLRFVIVAGVIAVIIMLMWKRILN